MFLLVIYIGIIKINNKCENKMTKVRFNKKYRKHDIRIDRDFDLYIDNCFKFIDIDILKNAINDYKNLISKMS